MTSQNEFNRYVEEYNQAYIALLTRASLGDYHRLLSSFIPLKDLLDLIRVMHDTLKYAYQVLPYPFPFRDNEPFLRSLDSYVFNHQQKQFNKAQAASRSSMMLRMEASAL
jgi:hypothetical protein